MTEILKNIIADRQRAGTLTPTAFSIYGVNRKK